MKQSKIKYLFLLLLLILIPLLTADVAPPAIASFKIIYTSEPPRVESDIRLYMCDTAECTYPQLLEKNNLEAGYGFVGCGFTGETYTCYSYDYAKYLYLIFDFADGTSMKSNVIELQGKYNEEYAVLVGEDTLTVGKSSLFEGEITIQVGKTKTNNINFIPYFCCCVMILTLIIMIAVVIVIRSNKKKNKEE